MRRVALFEDMKFVSETIDEDNRTEERKRNVERAPKAAPTKRSKSLKEEGMNMVVRS